MLAVEGSTCKSDKKAPVNVITRDKGGDGGGSCLSYTLDIMESSFKETVKQHAANDVLQSHW